MSTNACSSTLIFSVMISVFPWFSMKVIVNWWFFVPAWVTLKLWKGVFSYNCGMENLMVQFVFNEHQWMFINFHLFSVDQCVSLIFHESSIYLMIFVSAWVTFKLLRGVFSYNFGMENLMVESVFNEHQWRFINFHLFSVDQCVSLIFHESSSYLIIFVSAWVTFKLWKAVFSYNCGMETLMVQSVFNEHQCMFIHFHLFSVDQCISLIFHKSYSYLIIFCGSMSVIKTMKRRVFIQFRYGQFNGEICLKWAPMHVHQLSSFQCWSVCFLDFLWKL